MANSVAFDTHVHFFDSRLQQLNAHWEIIFYSAVTEKVRYFCNVGINLSTSQTALQQAEKFSNIFTAVGIHPNYINELNQQSLSQLDTLAAHSSVVAIGEIGLDYYRDHTSREQQTIGLHQQLQLATRRRLPVLLHIREAYADAYDIVRNYSVSGIVHCFSGNLADARKFIDLGFLIAIGGVVTFKNAAKLQAVVQAIDLKHLVVETDAPYLAPVPYRGQINQPAYIWATLQKIASLKQLPLDVVAQQTTANALRIFKHPNLSH